MFFSKDIISFCAAQLGQSVEHETVKDLKLKKKI